MITENLSTLTIHKLTQKQYERERDAGRLDENALYLTPDYGSGSGAGFVAQPEAPSDTSVLWLDTDDDSVDTDSTASCFKSIDNTPYFHDGYTEKKLILQEELDQICIADAVANFTNVLPNAKDTDGTVFNGIGYTTQGTRLGTDGAVVEDAYHGCTGFIPVKQGDVVYGKDIKLDAGGRPIVVIYDASFNYIMHATGENIGSVTYYFGYETSDDGFALTVKQKSTVAYVRFCYTRTGLGAKPTISVNEPISYTISGFLQDGIKVKGENVIGGPGSGASSWEDLGSKYENGVVLPECSPMFVDASVAGMNMFMFTEAFPLVEGEEYTVNWNGTPFTCICSRMAMGTATGLGLGNIGMLTGGDNTGEPFVLGVFDDPASMGGIPAAAIPLDGSTSLTISVFGLVESITHLPEKYLPGYALLHEIEITESAMESIIDGSVEFGYNIEDPDNKKAYDRIVKSLQDGSKIVFVCKGANSISRFEPTSIRWDGEKHEIFITLTEGKIRYH